jgi:hypothetical protein
VGCDMCAQFVLHRCGQRSHVVERLRIVRWQVQTSLRGRLHQIASARRFLRLPGIELVFKRDDQVCADSTLTAAHPCQSQEIQEHCVALSGARIFSHSNGN